MTKQGKKPPKFAGKLLNFFANRQSNSAIAGDLEEEFSEIAEERGTLAALFWYWKLILISFPSFLFNRFNWSLIMFRNYGKIAFRTFLRNRLFSGINLLGLAVGMACFILISLWVRDELSYDKFHDNKDRLGLLTIKHPGGQLDRNVPYALTPALASDFPEIENYSRIYSLGATTCTFKYQPDTGHAVMFYEDSVAMVDPSFFSIFSFPFIQGNAENVLGAPNSLVITEAAAEKYFGDDDPLGKKLTFNNRDELIVAGIIRIPSNSHLRFDFILRLEESLADNWNWRDPAYVLLKENVILPELNQKIRNSFNQKYPSPLPGEFEVGVLPIDQVHLAFGRRTYVYIFSLIAVFILFIACINYMNLATASAGGRSREVGLRKVVGAKRGQLISQFLGESLLMSFFAFLIALVLVRFLIPVLNSLTLKQLDLFSILNTPFCAAMVGLIFMVGLLSGSYPAFYLTGILPLGILRGGVSHKSNRSVFRVVSVVGQFSVSILLIVCTSVVFRQLNYVRNRPMGLNPDYVLKIQNNPSLLRRFSTIKDELLRNPNIKSVTRGQAVPFHEDYKTGGVEWEGKDQDLVPLFRYSISDFDFFETFEMEILDGRSFSRDFSGDQRNFVVNQAAVQYMGLENPVGQRLGFWGVEGRIIGVVKDFHHVSLHREILPHIITINPRFYSNWIKFVFVKISFDRIPETLAFIEGTFQRMTPEFPLEYSFLDQGVSGLYETEKRLGRMFTYFASLAIFISCLGIFGLSAFTAEQRTKEIGIRKVLGSSVSGIVFLLSKQFSRWVLLANLVAWPLAFYAMNKWLQEFAYRTGMSILIFIAAGLLSFAFAAIPVLYQTFKAAYADPVHSLRCE